MPISNPVNNRLTSAVLLAATLAFAALPASAQDTAPQAETILNLIVDPGLTSLSTPHLRVCQQGFEDFFGVPDGMDPDEALIIRGARQTYLKDERLGDAFGSTLEIAMPYERVLPPGPPDGAVLTGKITCYFAADDAGAFPLAPYAVLLEEEGQSRRIEGEGLALFR
ncbi:hypothetical protein [Pyruvatibacter sp.]|uniref:hypothetical protein n=1 Tax=Pyruvatibacter sp. TaxID=1981328 RepID=UPI0032EAB74E